MEFLKRIVAYFRKLVSEYLPFLSSLSKTSQAQALLEDVADYIEELLDSNSSVGDFDLELGANSSLLYTVDLGDRKIQFAISATRNEDPMVNVDQDSVASRAVVLENIPVIYVEDVMIVGDVAISYHSVKAAIRTLLK